MWANHDQFECIAIGHPVGEKVLRGVDLEFVDADAAELSAFLLADGGVVDDLPNLSVQNLLLLLPESPDPLLKCA